MTARRSTEKPTAGRLNVDKSRRGFLTGGVLSLACVTAGTLTWQGCGSSDLLGTTPKAHVAGFGWEVANLHGDGASVHIKVLADVIMSKVNIDLAYMITSTVVEVSFAKVLCRGSLSRGAPPTFPLAASASSDFDTATAYNPNSLVIVYDPVPLPGVFCSVILKSQIPARGTASGASRHVQMLPSLLLMRDDYLTFNVEHTGAPGDAEMQVALEYE
jgi:hypothetical protein